MKNDINMEERQKKLEKTPPGSKDQGLKNANIENDIKIKPTK